MPDTTQHPTGGATPANATPTPAELLAQAQAILDSIGKPAPVPPVPIAPVALSVAGTVEQTDDSAIMVQVRAARERLAAREAEEKELRELETKLAKYDRDKAGTPQRRSEFNLKDATDYLRETLGVAKDATVQAFRSIAGRHQFDQSEYVRLFGTRSPMEVLICGAIVPERGNDGVRVFAPGGDDELVREVRDLHDGVLVWKHAAQAQANGAVPIESCPIWARYVAARRKLEIAVVGRALDTSDTSLFVPTSFSAELVERYNLKRQVVSKFRQQLVPRFPFEIYGSGARPTVYAIAEQTADPESATAVTTSDPVDRRTSFARHRLGARNAFSYDLEADSIIGMAVWVRGELADALADGEEKFVVDSDNATFHQDVDITGALSGTDIRRQILGLRAHCVDQSFTTTLSTFTVENLNLMIEAMNKYAANPAECCWIGAPRVRAKLVTIVNAGNFPMVIGLTNPPATTGSVNIVNQFLGIDFIVMETFRTDLNATGFYDGTTTNNTGLLLVNHRRWSYAYDSLAPMVESIRWPRTQQVEMVISIRRDFVQLDAATERSAWYGIDVAAA